MLNKGDGSKCGSPSLGVEPPQPEHGAPGGQHALLRVQQLGAALGPRGGRGLVHGAAAVLRVDAARRGEHKHAAFAGDPVLGDAGLYVLDRMEQG